MVVLQEEDRGPGTYITAGVTVPSGTTKIRIVTPIVDNQTPGKSFRATVKYSNDGGRTYSPYNQHTWVSPNPAPTSEFGASGWAGKMIRVEYDVPVQLWFGSQVEFV